MSRDPSLHQKQNVGLRFGVFAAAVGLFLLSCTSGTVQTVTDQRSGTADEQSRNGEQTASGVPTQPEESASSTTSPPPTAQATTLPLETSPPETAPRETLPPPRSPVVLGFAGDTSFTNGLDERDPFGAVSAVLQAPDLMVLNLETAIADPGVGSPPVQKSFLFRSPPDSLGLLVQAGVDVVALANNHSLDYGAEALAQTLDEIDKTSLLRVGAGLDEDAAYHQLIVDVGEWRVGLVSLSRVPCDWSASGENVRPQVAWACPPFLDLADDLVVATMANSDVTVVMVHGGKEGVLCPSGFMVDLEQHWADLGVDLVIDGHPHVTQGITSIPRVGRADTLVVHSMGNFAFPSANGITANTAVFEFTVSETERDNPLLSLHVQPLRAPRGVLGLPTIEQHDAIVEQLNRVSDGWRLDSEGNAVKDSDHRTSC